jgi:hypothetical protein
MKTKTLWHRGWCRSLLGSTELAAMSIGAASLALIPDLANAQLVPVPSMEQVCFDLVQGKIPWNMQGNTTWNPHNIRSLCGGTTNPPATIACFTSKIAMNVPWNQAIAACKSQTAGGGQPPVGGAQPPGGGAQASEAAAAARSAEAAAGINGHTATLVVFGPPGGQKRGDYRQIGPGQWAETSADGVTHFQFQETGRDDWSVYLLDNSRGVKVQLDLYTRQVKYDDGHSPQRVLYRVQSASAVPAGGSPVPNVAQAATQPMQAMAPQPMQTAAAPQSMQPAAAAGGGSQIDPSRVVLRSGPVNDANDAAAKCSAICQPYQGYSGHFAITNPPNLGVCQCNAQPLSGVKPNEIAASPMQTNADAARVCPTACQWYGGGDGTWHQLSDGTSVCGCVQAVQ